MQKLVTIYLDREGYRVRGQRSPSESYGMVQEHLEDYLAAGWEIKLITCAGGAGADGAAVKLGCAWIAVVLEKSDRE